MASILCKLHIVLVVLGVSVILIEPSEGEIDSKILSTIFCGQKEIKTTKFEALPDGVLSNLRLNGNGLLIGTKEDLKVLKKAYKKLPHFLAKTKELREKFSHIRDVAGDGNCFFRAYAFGYFEYLLNHSQEIANFKTLVRKIKDELFNWFDKKPVEKMHKMFEKVITVTESGNSEGLFQIFNEPRYSDNVVQYLRLIASAEMRKNEDQYCDYITNDFTFDKFCCEEVETMGIDSDNIQIIALSNALKINVQVASINEVLSPKTVFVKLPDENRQCCVHLLHSPGHYSILYSIKEETCNYVESKNKPNQLNRLYTEDIVIH